MTIYAVDEVRAELVVLWETGRGAVVRSVSTLPVGAVGRPSLAVASALSNLSAALWRCYTQPESAVDRHLDPPEEGRRRRRMRQGFTQVPDIIRTPNLPTGGAVLQSYDPVEEMAHQVGQSLHAIGDAELTARVIADVEAELAAVERAECGDLSGRSKQAVLLSRRDASPVQVAVADEILARDPLGGDDLFELDPTSAAVAAAHWLQAAVDVVSRNTGIPATEVLIQADSIEAIPHETSNAVLELLAVGLSPNIAVPALIREAVVLADGGVPDIELLETKVAESYELWRRHESGDRGAMAEHTRLRLTTLDPRRPALDMLEDLLAGIHGCRLLYRAIDVPDDGSDLDDERLDGSFCGHVRSEAGANRTRLGLPAS